MVIIWLVIIIAVLITAQIIRIIQDSTNLHKQSRLLEAQVSEVKAVVNKMHCDDNVKGLNVAVRDGYLRATVSSDPDYPGIDVEYITHNDNGENPSRPRVLVEYPYDDDLRVLVWDDTKDEDYKHEIKLYKASL